MEYIGQNHLQDSVASIYKKGAAILIGPDKYGKTLFAQNVAKEIGLEYVLVESNVENTKALIEEIQPGSLYHIKDLHKARQQVISRLLKLLEDNIPAGAIILITTESTRTIDTILSRCLVLKCRKYKVEELKSVKEIDEVLYRVYDTPTKLADVNEDVDKIISSVEDFMSDPSSFKTNSIGDYDYKIVANILISKLLEKEKFKTIARIEKLVRGFERSDFIPNWQVVHMLLEDVKDDII